MKTNTHNSFFSLMQIRQPEDIQKCSPHVLKLQDQKTCSLYLRLLASQCSITQWTRQTKATIATMWQRTVATFRGVLSSCSISQSDASESFAAIWTRSSSVEQSLYSLCSSRSCASKTNDSISFFTCANKCFSSSCFFSSAILQHVNNENYALFFFI